LVLAIPRGAVPMASVIAESLDGEMDVVLVHKLSAPGQPELAIGSVDERGQVYISEHAGSLGVGDEYIAREKKAQMKILSRRRALYTPVHPPIDPLGRIVIVVDDGIATGATMVGSLPVVEDGGMLVGLVSEFDLLNILTKGRNPKEVRAEEIMTRDVKFVREDTPVDEIIRLLETDHLIRVPVVKDGKLVGIVARRDILFGYIKSTAEYWP